MWVVCVVRVCYVCVTCMFLLANWTFVWSGLLPFFSAASSVVAYGGGSVGTACGYSAAMALPSMLGAAIACRVPAHLR